VIGRPAAIAAVAASASVSVVALAAAGGSPQRYATAAPTIVAVPMSASCQPEAAADVDAGAAWLLVRAARPARAAFDRAVDRDPDCALGYWGQALARFDDAAAGSTPIVATVEATIARAAAVPARTPFERAAVAALGRLRTREAAPGVPAAWPARVAAYRDALCGEAAADRLVRLWCARALADTWTSLPAPGLAPGVGPDVPALEHVVELARTQPLDVGAAVIVLEVAPDPQAPIVTRALAAVAAANPPAPVPHALAARTAIRRGEWTTAVTAAERARAAGPEDPRAVDAVHAQIDALLQLGRRAEAYALAHRVLSANGASGATGGAPAETAARLYARVVLGDRRLDGRGLGARAALPLDERTAGLWPVLFVAGLDAALRAWPGPDATLVTRARAASTQLGALAPEGRSSEIAWARTLIDAAIAASQDEHPELALRLVHAIDMERTLAAADKAALPLLPARELGAELWLRTYRYDDARRDARALLDAQPQRISPFVVLARANDRVKDTSAAAEAWRRVLELRATADADDTIRLEAQQALEPAR
jgi:tetratricopeptide (TPR) repeat protein